MLVVHCNTDELRHYLMEALPKDVRAKYQFGALVLPSKLETSFRDNLDSYINGCNNTRTCAEGYELCEDFNPKTGVTDFYVMREDGKSMATFSVLFEEGARV